MSEVPYRLFEDNDFQARYGLLISQASYRPGLLVQAFVASVSALGSALAIAVTLLALAPLLVVFLVVLAAADHRRDALPRAKPRAADALCAGAVPHAASGSKEHRRDLAARHPRPQLHHPRRRVSRPRAQLPEQLEATAAALSGDPRRRRQRRGREHGARHGGGVLARQPEARGSGRGRHSSAGADHGTESGAVIRRELGLPDGVPGLSGAGLRLLEHSRSRSQRCRAAGDRGAPGRAASGRRQLAGDAAAGMSPSEPWPSTCGT